MKNWIKNLHIPFWYVVMLIVLAVALLVGCKTKYVAVPEYHKEYISKTDSFVRVDTVKEREWVTIREVDSVGLARLGVQLKGLKRALVVERNRHNDKVRIEHVLQRDTVLKTDSVRVPYPIERKLNRWEQVKMDVGGIAIGAVGVVLAFIVTWLVKKIKQK